MIEKQDINEVRRIVEYIAGGHHIDFSSCLNQILYEQNPGTDLKIEHGCYSVDRILHMDICGNVIVDMNRPLLKVENHYESLSILEDEYKIIKNVINRHAAEMFPGIFKPDNSCMDKFSKDSEFPSFTFGKPYSLEAAEIYRKNADKYKYNKKRRCDL